MRATIVSRIYRPEPSAASFFLGSVADALISDGHDVSVLTARPPQELTSPSPRETVYNFPVLRDREGYVRGYLPYMSFDVPLAIRLLFLPRPDVVFVEPPPTTGAVVRVICAIRRIPYVYDAADIWSDAANMATGSQLVIRVLRTVEKFAMNGASSLVTISSRVVDRVRALGVSTSATVTGFGADTSAFTITGEATQPLFVYAGSYSAWHGADIIIDAFADFSTTHPGHVLRIIGNGTEREVLEARARSRGVASAVEFMDPVPPSMLNSHFAAALASLATLKPGTQYEYAFATKTYSSLAAGCPVIFSGPGPTGPFLDEANTYVSAGIHCEYDAAEIAAAMRQIADDPLTADARSAVRTWIDDTHSMRAVAQRVVAQLVKAARARKES